MNTNTTPQSEKPGLAKRAQIDAGLRRLCSSRTPGQTFSQREIAQSISEHEVKTCHRTIQMIECKALSKIAKALAREIPEVLHDAYGAAQIQEVLATLSSSRHSPARVKQAPRPEFKPAPGKLCDTAAILRRRRLASATPKAGIYERDDKPNEFKAIVWANADLFRPKGARSKTEKAQQDNTSRDLDIG